MKRLFFLSLIIASTITTFMFGAMAGNAVGFNPINSGLVLSGTWVGVNLISSLLGVPIIPSNVLSATCGKIAASITFNCASPPAAGTRDVMYLINLEDWDATDTVIDYDPLNPQVITSITLPVGKLAYRVEGRNNSNAPSSTMAEGTYTDSFDHAVNFVGFDLSNAAMLNYQNMVGGRYVAIVEHNYRGTTGESAFKAYGAGAGLKLRTFVIDPNNGDTQGAATFGLASTDVSKEPKIPFSIFDTDYATTKTMVEGLAA